MSIHVVIRPAAERDIEQALDWYMDNAPEHAERFTDDLRETIDVIGTRRGYSAPFTAGCSEPRCEGFHISCGSSISTKLTSCTSLL